MTSPVFFPVSGDYQCINGPDPQSTTSTPEMAVVQALVTFTPRLPRGFMAFVDNYQISQDTNGQQTVSLIGAINGGSWGLNFNGVWINPYLPPGSAAADVQAALEALSTIGAGNVTVTGPTGGPYAVEFVGALGNSPQPQMLSDASQLSVSSGVPAVPVWMVQPGSASRVGPTALTFPPVPGRIWTTGQLCSINVADSPNVELMSDFPELGMTFPLIYDVTFNTVQAGDVPGALAPVAFTAPPDSTGFSLTDPNSDLLVYSPPINVTWYPGWVPPPPPPPLGGVLPLRRDWRKAG